MTNSSIQKDFLKVNEVILLSDPLTVLAHFPVITFVLFMWDWERSTKKAENEREMEKYRKIGYVEV